MANMINKEHKSKLIKSTLEISPGRPRAVYLIDGTKINIEWGENGGSWLKIGETPKVVVD